MAAALNEGRTDATIRARRDETEPPQESVNTGGASSSSAGADVHMRLTQRWQTTVGASRRTMTWCADWTCVTSSVGIPQMYT